MTSLRRALLTLATSLLLAATAKATPVSNEDAFAVGKLDRTLVDPSRVAGEPRSLETSLWFPARRRPLEWLQPGPAPLAQSACPAPLVIYSHGFMSRRHNGAHLARLLAAHGYIVAAPDFPRTRLGAPGGPAFTDVLNQPGDVSFIIDSLLQGHGAIPADLTRCIDSRRIAAVGLSLGGLTTTLLAFHPTLRDARIRAAVSIAGPVALLGPGFFHDDAPPFMMIAGDIDAMVDYAANVQALADWYPAATIITLQGGSHTGFAGIAGWLFRWLDNPDSIGCRALDGRVDAGMAAPDGFMAQLRGQPGATNSLPDLRPCRTPTLPSALRPQHQLMLTRLSILAFLQSVLAADPATRASYEKQLWQTLPARYPALHSGVLPTPAMP